MDYWFLFRQHYYPLNKLMISCWAFIIMSILLFNIDLALSQHQAKKPKSSKIRFPGPSGYSRKYQNPPQPNPLPLIVGFQQPVTFPINYEQPSAGLLLGMSPQHHSDIANQHKNPTIYHNPINQQAVLSRPLSSVSFPPAIPSHYLLPVNHNNIIAGYNNQQNNIPIKQYELPAPDYYYTTPKQEENNYDYLASFDVNEILFYPNKVLASYVPSGSESFKPMPANY